MPSYGWATTMRDRVLGVYEAVVQVRKRVGDAKRYSLAVFFTLAWTFCHPVEAFELQSVELSGIEAIKEGLRNSPQVQSAEAQAEEKSWGKIGTLSGFLPSLSVNAQHFFSAQYQYLNVNFTGTPSRFPMLFPNTSVSVSAFLPIFDGFQNWDRYQAGRLRAEAALDQFSWVKLQVQQEIREKFYQALAAQILQRVHRENLKTIQDHLDQVKLFRKGGTATHYDLLRVEVQKSEAETELLQAEDQFYLARQKLAVSMGLTEDQRELQGVLPDPNLKFIEQLNPQDVSLRGDLQAEKKNLEASHRSYLADRSFWIPKISLGAQYTRYGQMSYNGLVNSVQDLHQFQSAYHVGVFLNWNVFDGLSSWARARQTYYQEVQAEKQFALTQLRIPYEFEIWRRKYRYSAALYQAKKTEILKAQESVRLAQEGYRAGIRTNTEVLDAELELFRARAGVVHAQLSCAEALIHLELALGRTVPSQFN